MSPSCREGVGRIPGRQYDGRDLVIMIVRLFAIPFFLYASVSVFRYNEGERGWAPARQTLACQSYSSVG